MQYRTQTQETISSPIHFSGHPTLLKYIRTQHAREITSCIHSMYYIRTPAECFFSVIKRWLKCFEYSKKILWKTFFTKHFSIAKSTITASLTPNRCVIITNTVNHMWALQLSCLFYVLHNWKSWKIWIFTHTPTWNTVAEVIAGVSSICENIYLFTCEKWCKKEQNLRQQFCLAHWNNCDAKGEGQMFNRLMWSET